MLESGKDISLTYQKTVAKSYIKQLIDTVECKSSPELVNED